VPLRELMDDRLLDALLERSKDEAGGLRLTGAGSMLGELVAAVLERALQAELGAHLATADTRWPGAGGEQRVGLVRGEVANDGPFAPSRRDGQDLADHGGVLGYSRAA
jgi:hypothetical protein